MACKHHKGRGSCKACAVKKFQDGGEEKTLSLVDNRDTNVVTGRALDKGHKKNVTGINPDVVDYIVKKSIEEGRDPYTMLALATQETSLGTSPLNYKNVKNWEFNPFHLNDSSLYETAGTNAGKHDYKKAIDMSFNLMKEKDVMADKAGYTDEAMRLQGWNGWNVVSNETPLYGMSPEEMTHVKKSEYYDDYLGRMMPGEEYYTFDMSKNPIYGKQIIDMRENVLKKSPDIIDRVVRQTRPLDPPVPDRMPAGKAPESFPVSEPYTPLPTKREVEEVPTDNTLSYRDKLLHKALTVKDSVFKEGGDLNKYQDGETEDPEMLYKDKYNTPLNKRQTNKFNKWAAEESERQGRDILMDKGAYDVQGFWKNKDYKRTDSDGHGTDTWKKPNHPTFSSFSKYHGTDGNYGGQWKPDGGYQPSKQTMDLYSPGYYNWMFGNEPHRPEHLDLSRYKSGENAPTPLVYKEGGWLDTYEDGKVIDKTSKEYKEAYETGNITSYDPVTDTYQAKDLPPMEITADAGYGPKGVANYRDEFAKDYMEPVARVAAEANPATALGMAGYDIYDQASQGNYGMAALYGGLEAAPWGLGYLGKKALPYLKRSAAILKDRFYTPDLSNSPTTGRRGQATAGRLKDSPGYKRLNPEGRQETQRALQEGNKFSEEWYNHPARQKVLEERKKEWANNRIKEAEDYINTYEQLKNNPELVPEGYSLDDYSKNVEAWEEELKNPNRYNPWAEIQDRIKNKEYQSDFSTTLGDLLQSFKKNTSIHGGKNTAGTTTTLGEGPNYGISGLNIDPIIGLKNTIMGKSSPFGKPMTNLVDRGIPLKKIPSTGIHEGNHGLTMGDYLLERDPNFYKQLKENTATNSEVLYNKLGFSDKEAYRKYAKENPKWEKEVKEWATEYLETTKGFRNYLKEPAEVYARIMEFRKAANLSPEEVITDKRAKELLDDFRGNDLSKPATKFQFNEHFLKILTPKKLKFLLNNLPAATGAVAGTAALTQEKKNGGWLDNLD